MMNDNKFKFEINGITLESDTLYEVIPKPDYDAPDGFQEYGTTKLLHPKVSNKVCCVFNSQSQVWDTGFFINSPCYAGIDTDSVKITVDVLNRHIVKPMERLLGDDKLSHKQSNNDYWDRFNPEIKKGKVFNTAKPQDLFELYIAARHHFLAPKDKSSNPSYRKAQYCIVNKAEVTNLKQERKFKLSKAIGQSMNLMTNNKKKLDHILSYLGITSTLIKDEMTLNSVISNYLEDKKSGSQNVTSFLEVVEKASTDGGYMEVYLYSVVKTLYKKKKVTKEGIDYFYKDYNLGTSFKSAAKIASIDMELQTQLIEDSE